ncbi:ABC transporter substrate-binding protein [Arthrobacter sp. HY1533]|uniref:ABC transporter substrate-binding protein n=1 Tax=Arthrobacter sp. HY1533 TaxID=2970919 RepID=UPI0022B9DE4B|nr:extracellular solute-binding protein [Arthrobacter sp. HY1533]
MATGLSSCAAEAPADGPATITVLAHQQVRADAIKAEIPAFEAAMAKQGQKITVKLETDILTDAQFSTKITQQYNAGTAPDVVDMNSAGMSGYAGAGYLLPLDDYLAKWPGWESFFPITKAAAKAADGKTYALPHEMGVQSLFYRKDVLTKLGIDTSQPKTWDELIGRLQKISAATGGPAITLPAGTAWGGGSWAEGFGNIVAGTDGKFFDESTGKWDVKNEGVAASFDLFAKLTQDKLLPVQDLQNPNPWIATKYKGFVDGSIPVAGQGSWGWKYDWGPSGSAPIEDLTSKVSTWNFPALDASGSPYVTTAPGFSWAVTAKTKYADASVKFIQWMSSDEALANQLVAVGAVSPRSGLDSVAPYSNEPQLLEAEAQLTKAVTVPYADGVDQISMAVQKATEDILNGASGSEATSTFVKQATDLLGPTKVN